MNFSYNFAVMGGTFDRLHAGHKKMLDLAFGCAGEVVIGLTSDKFVTKKNLSLLILPYDKRRIELESYLNVNGFEGRFEIVEISDVYGTTLTDSRFDVIVVSEETKKGADIVNSKRQELNLPMLPVAIADLVMDENGEKISSERIRAGMVSRDGIVYANVFNKSLVLSLQQKKVLATPMDDMYSDGDLREYTKVSVVGDKTLNHFQAEKLRYEFAIYDLKIGRKEMVGLHGGCEAETIVANEAGVVDASAVSVIAEIIKNGSGMIRVVGEEDLLVLPSLMLLPLGSLIVYGQPGEGMVGLRVNEESKHKWYEFLKKG